ncbi:TIGR02530 family flagellar biosynthesis protein [Eubacterium xylanophilum]|uniref:TIGR02530 family flagellar biosynthesis protein n=1 Tax=Eubacterium xylanophilum TaxID=39497 RepID=UPI0004AFA8E2|nr:TIGR02530 family flagellar biosynthesis protein [Eubacterium xylanophilum]
MMNILNNNYASIDEIRDKISTNPHVSTRNEEKTKTEESFKDVFLEMENQVKFSKHASKRLETRNISMTDSQRQRLEDATERAKEKGMKESLVMVDDLAFIVNVQKKTIVTAVNDTEKAIFTNIDGAVIN